MPNLSFALEYRYPDHPDGISLPVALSYGDKSINAIAKVDTGAEFCLFRNEDGHSLGIPLEQGERLVLRGIGGAVEAYGHQVVVNTLGLAV